MPHRERHRTERIGWLRAAPCRWRPENTCPWTHRHLRAARSLQAALASAATFAVGAALPIAMVVITPPTSMVAVVSATPLVFLAGLGALAAGVGGASPWVGAGHVAFWGALAMGATAAVGALFGTAVA
ncbi:MAG: VIT1/CCC1 transporter family protein [Vicinamibacterales bacterium]